MKKFKNIALAAFIIVVGASTVASATTYLGPVTLTGTNASTSYVMLGDGTRWVKATCTSGNGTVTAKKIVKLWPDSTVASFSISNGYSSSRSFGAQSIAPNGDWQSYYIKWSGNSSTAKANVSFTD
jgi:hypothetical protein